MLQDFRFAFRTFARNPLFTLGAVVTLALGIGVNSTLFSLTNAVLFRPMPGITEPDRLAWVSVLHRDRGRVAGMSYPDYLDYRDGSGDTFAELMAFSPTPLSLGSCRLTQAGVADALGLSAPQLSSLFSSQTGLTFAEYLRDIRLDRSALLLVTGVSSIKEIWSAVGYNDASNFCHQFRDRFGAAPREHRARAIRGVLPSAPLPHAGEDWNGTPASRGGGALLIVDDDAGTCETLGRHLRSIGYSVTTAGTGEAALGEASKHALDVIVLDHHLPDMNGIQCLERLRQQGQAYSPAVLLFTADWDVADEAAHIAELGAMFASKLCDLEEVERLVGSLLMVRASLGETLRDS